MKKGLLRYKDPAGTIKKRNEYNQKHYRSFHLRFSYRKDKELIDELESGNGYAKTVRRWYKESKRGG